MTELIFQKELMLTRQINGKNVCLVIKNKNFSYGPYLYGSCYNMTQKSIDFKNIDIVCVKGNAYRIHFWHMSKHKCKSNSKAISLIND